MNFEKASLYLLKKNKNKAEMLNSTVENNGKGLKT